MEPTAQVCMCWADIPTSLFWVNLFTLVDVDECQANNGDCEQGCTNTPGGHFCTCQDGFFLFNATNCRGTCSLCQSLQCTDSSVFALILEAKYELYTKVLKFRLHNEHKIGAKLNYSTEMS